MTDPRMILTANLPPRWGAGPVRHHCRVVNGGTPTADEDNWDGDIPFITPPDIRAHLGRLVDSTLRTLTEQGARSGSVVAKHGVIVSNRAPIGYVARLSGPSAFNQGCKVLLPRRLDERFLTFVMLSAAPSLEVLGQGTTFMEISSASLGSVSIPVPPLDEQRAIADYLDRETAKIDALIAKQTTMIERFRERRAGVVATAIGDHGDMAPLASLAQKGGFFDGDWVESKDQDPIGEIRLLQLADVGDGEFRDRSNRHINAETFARLRCTALRTNDILIARMPDPLGRACLLPADQTGAITVVDVAVLRVDEAKALPKYAMYALNSAPTRSAIELQQDGATRQRIPRKKLGKIALPLPPLDEQREIADYLDRETAKIDTLITKVERHIELAKERRAALITAAVTGQIDVTKDAA